MQSRWLCGGGGVLLLRVLWVAWGWLVDTLASAVYDIVDVISLMYIYHVYVCVSCTAVLLFTGTRWETTKSASVCLENGNHHTIVACLGASEFFWAHGALDSIFFCVLLESPHGFDVFSYSKHDDDNDDRRKVPHNAAPIQSTGRTAHHFFGLFTLAAPCHVFPCSHVFPLSCLPALQGTGPT